MATTIDPILLCKKKRLPWADRLWKKRDATALRVNEEGCGEVDEVTSVSKSSRAKAGWNICMN